ncbi:hypothetical protein GGTG_05830 [Gaeumannomyces tritici R3-111a-1]|uniref:Uncharacterized protein n=1 Tax=Gaeumannomyces tritici (strain R3-111a-1) TaxID=644352 RepID=J3NX22_GAET3|nr:hypothetical protein GGTG_05830 [Gaeumannomyces tritici R3-111a-1]EJT75904.1 hypothetical protein GGTG_05830 [Gaeumannomyces tritici R3-111a-1]
MTHERTGSYAPPENFGNPYPPVQSKNHVLNFYNYRVDANNSSSPAPYHLRRGRSSLLLAEIRSTKRDISTALSTKGLPQRRLSPKAGTLFQALAREICTGTWCSAPVLRQGDAYRAPAGNGRGPTTCLHRTNGCKGYVRCLNTEFKNQTQPSLEAWCYWITT